MKPAGNEPELAYARELIDREAKALANLSRLLDERFARALRMILDCRGQVVVSGMGKAGIIGEKISSTLVSTGTPSIFLHPADALHGDLACVRNRDIVLVLSKSGETREITRLVREITKIGARIVAVTSSPDSHLGRHSDVVLDIGDVDEDMIPEVPAPSASTTAMLALGDALALTLAKMRSFSRSDFVRFHPEGSVGLKVEDIMRTGMRHTLAKSSETVADVLRKITLSQSGAASIVDDAGKLVGIFTDGGFRRLALDEGSAGTQMLLARKVGEVMTPGPRFFISKGRPALEAMKMLKENKVDELPVVDGDGSPIGMIDVQDLLESGIL